MKNRSQRTATTNKNQILNAVVAEFFQYRCIFLKCALTHEKKVQMFVKWKTSEADLSDAESTEGESDEDWKKSEQSDKTDRKNKV